MDNIQFIGYLITSIVTLGAFVGVVMKFVQPINDLRVVIQKLNDAIDTLTRDNAEQNYRINKHGEQIDDLNNRVTSIESNMNRK
jgi:division protein CdvB (Snf7/Vps24/ESCRT-III family)